MKKKSEYSGIFAIVFLLNFVPVIMWRGWVLSLLWGWFVVRLGMPAVSIPEAIGVSLVLSYLTGTGHIAVAVEEMKEKTTEENDKIPPMGKIFIGWAMPAFVLLYGWILQKFL